MDKILPKDVEKAIKVMEDEERCGAPAVREVAPTILAVLKGVEIVEADWEDPKSWIEHAKEVVANEGDWSGIRSPGSTDEFTALVEAVDDSLFLGGNGNTDSVLAIRAVLSIRDPGSVEV